MTFSMKDQQRSKGSRLGVEVQEACISSGKSVLPHLSLGVHTSLQEGGPFVSPPITPQMQHWVHEKNGRDQLQVNIRCDGTCMRDCVCSITEWYPTLLSRSLKLLFQPLLCLVLPLGILSLKKNNYGGLCLCTLASWI